MTDEVPLSIANHLMFGDIKDMADVTTFNRERKDLIRSVVEKMTRFHIKRGTGGPQQRWRGRLNSTRVWRRGEKDS